MNYFLNVKITDNKYFLKKVQKTNKKILDQNTY